MGIQEQQLEVGFQIDIVKVYMGKSNYEQALLLIEVLANHSSLLEHQRIELLVCRAECYLRSNHFELAVQLLGAFLQEQHVMQTVSDEILCDLYNKLGNAHFRSHDFEKAYSAFEQGYRISLRLNEFGPIAARVTKNLGLTCNQIGYTEDAMMYLEKAYGFFERIADMTEVANTLFEMALATGNSEYMAKAQHIYEGLSLVREANFAKQHYAFHVQSKIDYQQAVEQLRATAEEFEKLGDPSMSIYTYSRAVKICLDHEDLEQAILGIRSAIDYEEKLTEKNPYLVSYFYKVKAELNLRLENYDTSIHDSEKSCEMYDILGMHEDGAEALQISAKAYQEQGDFIRSHKVLLRVIELLRKAHRRN